MEEKDLRKKLKVEDCPMLHPNEVRLINKWRLKHRYAEITIVTQDGIPVRVRSGIEGEDLSKESYE